MRMAWKRKGMWKIMSDEPSCCFKDHTWTCTCGQTALGIAVYLFIQKSWSGIGMYKKLTRPGKQGPLQRHGKEGRKKKNEHVQHGDGCHP